MLRPIVLNIVGKSGDESVVKEAQKRFERHLNGDLIDPNIRGTVYALVARFGNEQTQEQLKKLYLSAEMTEEKVRVLRAMGQTIDPNLIQKTLEFVFETEHVRMQDSTAGLSGCTSSRIGRELSWKYLQNNWSKLLQRFGDKSSYLIYFVEIALDSFADDKIANEIQTFFESVHTPIVSRAVKQVVETIRMRSQVLQRDSKAIEDYLKNY